MAKKKTPTSQNYECAVTVTVEISGLFNVIASSEEEAEQKAAQAANNLVVEWEMMQELPESDSEWQEQSQEARVDSVELIKDD